MIFILEDNDERIAQFRTAAAAVAPDLATRFWRSAAEMIDDLTEGLEHASVISLDHDLNRAAGDERDPGSGYDVVQLLADLIPCCPVIVHTSNGERGTWMMAELNRTRWNCERVYPFGDEWIEKEWKPVLRRLLGRTMPC